MSSPDALAEGVAARAPGTSITRRRKPADAECGAAERGVAQPPAPAAPPPRLLQRRVDALHLRYRGGLSPAMREGLAAALAEAKDLGLGEIAVDVGARPMALSARSREGWWYLENDLVQVTIDEGKHLDGWGLTVKLRALTLADRGPEAAAVLSAEIATDLLHFVEGERVARIDLCADFTDFDVESIDTRQWVTSGRATPSRRAPTPDDATAEYFRASERVAFYVGKNDVVLRVYDKTVELQNDIVGEKRNAEHSAWRSAGWNGVDRVTRVEFQVRGDALKELDDGSLRDPARFVDRLDALWSYLTRKWVRLGRIGSATRRGRWTNDARWDAVQAVRFVAMADTPRRKRARGAPRVKYVAAINLTYAAKSGMLDGVHVPRASEVAIWTPAHAREFVKTKLAAMLGVVGEQLAYDLLHLHGPVRAAMALVERLHAAHAKSWTDACEQSPISFTDLFAAA